jgi:KaiC/GvpD/RAD55 family RecA-like ATPase
MPSVTEVFPELTLKDLVRTLIKVVEEEKVQRIVVDPITSVMLRYEKPLNRRKATLTLFDALAATGCSSLVTTELRTAMLDREFQIEEFLSQGVILLRTDIHQGNVVRALQIEKMRGISHDMQWRPYQITAEGIQVFPKDRVF